LLSNFRKGKVSKKIAPMERIKSEGDPAGHQHHSPLAALGSSDSSRSSPSSPRLQTFDSLDQKLSTAGSLRIGLPWNRSPDRGSARNKRKEELRYHGGIMMSDEEEQLKASLSQNSVNSGANSGRKYRFFGKKTLPLNSSMSSSEDTISNFRSSEWTPHDSAYGAACPVCGSLPKHTRRMIEFSLIAGMVIGFVYLLVTTSIDLSNSKSTRTISGSNATASDEYISGQIALDDDLYAAYNRNGDDDLYDDQIDDAVYYDNYSNGGN
jgi:hypothetical protein